MKSILLVATGGAIGSIARYLISIWYKQSYTDSFPWHTFFINIVGCILIGIFFALLNRNMIGDSARLFLMVGLLGGFTTFSSFGLETINLFQNKQYSIALLYVLGSNILGVLGVFIGYITFYK